MQHPSSLPFLSLILCLCFALPGDATAQRGYHVDTHVGFKFRLPVKWRRWPAEKDRRFLEGYYVSTKAWPIKGRRNTHRPGLRVLVFPKRQETKPEEPVSVVEYYADYKDYLARNLSGVITYASSTKGESDGVPYTEYGIRRRDDDRAYRLTTREYDFAGHVVAVEFMVLDEHATTLKQRLVSCLRSFRRVPVETDNRDHDPWRPPLWVRDPGRWSELDLKDRLAHRGKYEEEFLARVRANVAPTFKVKQSKHFLILSNADARYTTEIAKAADGCLEWCHENLVGVSDDAVMKAVIRIFGTRGDYLTYRARSRRLSHYVPEIREIVLAPGRTPPKELTGLDDLTQGILHYYLADKDKDIHRNLPGWIRAGLTNYLRLSKLERGKFVLEPNDYEKRIVREARRSKRIESVRRLITQTQTERDEFDRRLRYQRGRVVRFLVESSKRPLRRKQEPTIPAGFVAEYLVAVRAAQKQFGVDAWNPGRGRVPGLTDELAKKRAKADGKTRARLLETVNKAVCDWSDQRWSAVQKAYDEFNRNP